MRLTSARTARIRQRGAQAALALATPWADRDCSRRVFAKRSRTFRTELFVCVADPRVPFDNNAAERAFRLHVVARAICGGTRSAKGAVTTTPQSLLTTARLRGMNPMDVLLRLMRFRPRKLRRRITLIKPELYRATYTLDIFSRRRYYS